MEYYKHALRSCALYDEGAQSLHKNIAVNSCYPVQKYHELYHIDSLNGKMVHLLRKTTPTPTDSLRTTTLYDTAKTYSNADCCFE